MFFQLKFSSSQPISAQQQPQNLANKRAVEQFVALFLFTANRSRSRNRNGNRNRNRNRRVALNAPLPFIEFLWLPIRQEAVSRGVCWCRGWVGVSGGVGDNGFGRHGSQFGALIAQFLAQ